MFFDLAPSSAPLNEFELYVNCQQPHPDTSPIIRNCTGDMNGGGPTTDYLVQGSNTIVLKRIRGYSNITMSDAEVLEANLQGPYTFNIIDIVEGHMVNGVLEYYTFNPQAHSCDINLYYTATDNYYGVGGFSLATVLSGVLLAGSRNNGTFKESISVSFDDGVVSGLVLYDLSESAHNRLNVTLPSPVKCLVQPVTRDPSLFNQVAVLDSYFEYEHNSLSDPLVHVVLEVTNNNAPYPYQQLRPSFRYNSASIIANSSSQSFTLNVDLGEVESSTLIVNAKSTRQHIDGSPVITNGTVSQYNREGYPASETSYFSAYHVTSIINFTISNITDVSAIELVIITDYEFTIFKDTNVVTHLSGNVYTRYFDFPIMVIGNIAIYPGATLNIFISTSANRHGPFPINSSIIEPESSTNPLDFTGLTMTSLETSYNQSSMLTSLKSVTLVQLNNAFITKSFSVQLSDSEYYTVPVIIPGVGFDFPYCYQSGNPLAYNISFFTMLPPYIASNYIFSNKPTWLGSNLPAASSTFDMSGSQDYKKDIYPPIILDAYVDYDSKTFNVHATDPSGIQGCTIAPKTTTNNLWTIYSAQVAYSLYTVTPSNNSIFISDYVDVTIQYDISRFLQAYTCIPAILIQTKYMNRKDVRFEMIFTYPGSSPITSIIATFSRGDGGDSFRLAFPSPIVPVRVGSSMYSVITTSDLSFLNTSCMIDISLEFFTESEEYYQFNNEQLGDALRNTIPLGGSLVDISTLLGISLDAYSSASFLAPHHLDAEAPKITNRSVDTSKFPVVSMSVTDFSGVAFVEMTYVTSLDHEPATIRSTGPDFVFDLNPLARQNTCGSLTVKYFPSKVCDIYNNCQTFQYYDFTPLFENTSSSPTVPPTSSFTVTSFDYSPKAILFNTDDDTQRNITFEVTIQSALPLSATSLPKIFLTETYVWKKIVKGDLVLRSSNATVSMYRGYLVIPKNFGFQGMFISIYGIADICGNIYGMSHQDLVAANFVNAEPFGISAGCPYDCYFRGRCILKTGKCDCDRGFIGDYCQTVVTCPNNCSGNGVCTPSAYCSCNVGFSGPGCEVPSLTTKPTIDFDPNVPTCNYTVFDVEQMRSYSFDINIGEVQELDLNNTVVRRIPVTDMTKSIINSTDFTMSKRLNDGTKIIARIKVTPKYLKVNWMDEITAMAENTVKYSLSIGGFPFQSEFNSLRVTWNMGGRVMNTTGASSDKCSIDDFSSKNGANYGGGGYAPDDFSYLQASFFGYTLFGRFPTIGKSDGRQFKIINERFNNTDGQLQVATRIPFFWVNAEIDPDWSVLTNTQYDECASEQVSHKILIAAICGSIGGAVLVAAGVYFVVKAKHMVESATESHSFMLSFHSKPGGQGMTTGVPD
eukprot:gene2631-3030_t